MVSVRLRLSMRTPEVEGITLQRYGQWPFIVVPVSGSKGCDLKVSAGNRPMADPASACSCFCLQVCKAWEAEAHVANTRTVIMRIGVVLAPVSCPPPPPPPPPRGCGFSPHGLVCPQFCAVMNVCCSVCVTLRAPPSLVTHVYLSMHLHCPSRSVLLAATCPCAQTAHITHGVGIQVTM